MDIHVYVVEYCRDLGLSCVKGVPSRGPRFLHYSIYYGEFGRVVEFPAVSLYLCKILGRARVFPCFLCQRLVVVFANLCLLC